MNILLWLALPIALLAGLWFLWFLGVILTRASEAETLQEKMWNKNAARSVERVLALKTAQRTGDYSAYNALKAQHDKEFAEDCKTLASLETVVDDQVDYELSHGINPYKNVIDTRYSPSGNTIKAKGR